MVALSQTRSAASKRPHSKPIFRQTTAIRNPTSAPPTPTLLRARYYDPATSEFISQDPLEYVDGMSMFRGYLGISNVDAMGLAITKKDCEKAVNGISDGSSGWDRRYRHASDSIIERGCKEPTIVCLDGNDPRCRTDLGPKGGFVDPNEPGTINLCCDNINGVKEVVRIAIHEAVHVLDLCENIEWDCKETACSEIRAYSFANCRSTREWRNARAQSFLGCVRNRAIESLSMNLPCRKDADDTVREMMKKCLCKEEDITLPDWPMQRSIFPEL